MVAAIDRPRLLELIDGGEVQIVDVLPEREYTESHIPGAVNLPLKQLTVESASVLRRDKPVVVY
jgi:rhodanese-related sulfurtransferase